jgi:hypothetical protein
MRYRHPNEASPQTDEACCSGSDRRFITLFKTIGYNQQYFDYKLITGRPQETTFGGIGYNR